MLKRTALFDEHLALNGRMVEFGGWEMPVQYKGLMAEHLACRQAAGLFDVSHMGEVHVEGPRAEAFLNYLVTNDVSSLQIGQAQYTVMCNSQGGAVDDLLIYKRSENKYLVVINASNIEKDFDHMVKVRKTFLGTDDDSTLSVTNESNRYSQIAIQGRSAQKILQRLTDTPLQEIKTYWFAEGKLDLDGGIPALLARTGYTGEDGFEVYCAWEKGPLVWKALLAAGEPEGIVPCGLGARDTLRLEVAYPLYGHELGDEINPLEARLGWIVKLNKGDFLGRDSIAMLKEKGLSKKLVGLELLGRGIPRQDYTLLKDGRVIGKITSGTHSPTLKKAVGLGFVENEFSEPGTELEVQIRDHCVKAIVVKTPFYKRDY